MDAGTHSRRLSEAIGFTSLDLQANQAGRISAAQHAQFAGQVKSAMMQTLAMLVAIGLVALFTRLYVALVAIPGLLIPRWWALWARWLDERDGTVLSAQGSARLETCGGTHGTDFHCIRIHETVFDYAEMTDVICRAFQEGKDYRVYYLPHSKKIVSAEAVDPSRSS